MNSRMVIQISPQEMVLSNRDIILHTLLGSCVAICLYDSRGVGAMCHAMLPSFSLLISKVSNMKEKLKYVDSSLEIMIGRFAELGIPTQRLSAKLYGGANMFDFQRDDMMDVGSKNVETAHQLLSQKNIRIRDMDVGGRQGRKVSFHPRSGEVRLYLVPLESMTGRELKHEFKDSSAFG